MKGIKNAVKFRESVLCFVDARSAYFTTQKLSEQWGDDWNDAPYEHNAGTPYSPCWHNEPKHLKERGGKICQERCCVNDWNSDGTPKWRIIEVTFGGAWRTPAEIFRPNSPFSVEKINAGKTPWLVYVQPSSSITIKAGTTLKEFVSIINKFGSDVHRVRVV